MFNIDKERIEILLSILILVLLLMLLAFFLTFGTNPCHKCRFQVEGEELNIKEFFKQWKLGIQGVTPLQQIKVTLWAFLPIFGGISWGLVITFIAKMYWVTAILCGSLPLTTIQFISTLQKYLALRKVEEGFEGFK